MARPRQFTEERAIEAAMLAFWDGGYEGTSTQDLCTATGLGRSSIYNTFKSKRDLFEKALRRYMVDKNGPIVELMEGDLPAREKIRTLFQWAAEGEPGLPSGCMVVNAMVELAPHDAEVAALLREDHRMRLTAVRTAIEEGQRAGEIDPAKDAEALAHYVIATVSGMRVAGRGGSDRLALDAIATTALTAL
ncbi:TetR family transcriptional regulator [Spongiactinospora gelatinilytica]|uniref:TetR family transcriptional regulator n=1 Tax=Spongiactinospora gelatinilytica TaxID=2666298 RepID=A0A2W2GCQ4_9ACTN|nr:TetR/AcrR family transcriptional regulator [Spongiactinospora gelatinilytica]PZG35170.1 TetR family transcriptional regulator [Spongiactinospora gelatinilytica]